ncbi:hypothetical protein H8356DRAFT_1652639 [Neocallimastix lanati (nom. inval.)]|jgi:hypothetical protein|nr:hypothetical protein H8356DRAFT_1652639 [Neocallimastix sp. JGI-2020a]
MDMNETKNTSTSTETDNNNTLDSVINNKIDTEDIKDNQDKLSDIASPEESEISSKSNRIPLIIRCPFTTTDLNILIDASHNVLHLKKKIYKEFPSNPKPSDQRLIFGGRIIQNNEILQDVLKRQLLDLSTPPIIHLIINSLAIQHAKTVKPTSSNNSVNGSTNNTPSASVQPSPVGSKQDLSEITNTSTNDLSNITTNNNNSNNNNNTTNISSSSAVDSNNVKETLAPTTSKEQSPTTNISEIFSSKPVSYSNISSDSVQYILLNNIIYAVQPAPEYLSNSDGGLKIQSPVDFRSNTESDDMYDNSNNNTNETNNNNNDNNAQPADANINNNNGQQEILNQILNANDQQRQQPNQFFLFIRLAFIVYLLTQGGGYIRMIIVTFIAIIIFLVQTGRINVTVINYRNLPGVNVNANNNNNANQNEQANNNINNENNRDVNNDAAGNNENDPLLNNNADGNNNNDNNNTNNNNINNVVPQYSFLTNCRRVFFAFFLSLIPFIQDVA